jgi:hypothetical protein
VTKIRVQLCEEDRKEYGSEEGPLPEVMTLDLETLKDLRASELDAIDRALGVPLALFLEPLESWELKRAQVTKVAAWLAARGEGGVAPFADFDPRLLRATFVREDEASPPAGPEGGPLGPSSGDEAASSSAVA